MPELGDALRGYIDGIVAPVTLDEVTVDAGPKLAIPSPASTRRAGRSPIRPIAVAAALVAVSLLSFALLTSRGDQDQVMTTAPSPTDPGTSTTSHAVGTTAPTTTEPSPASTDTTTPTASVPGQPPALPPSTTTTPETTAVEPTTTFVPIPPPASIPPAAPIPDGQWLVVWSPYGNPTRDATSIAVSVDYAQCSGGERPGSRLKPPVVTETPEAIVITFWADALGPPDEGFACQLIYTPGRPPDYVVELSSPLGDRWVYDGRPHLDNPPTLVLDPNLRPR